MANSQYPYISPFPSQSRQPPPKRYLPTRRVDYVHMLQGPQFKVWKPFASFGIVISTIIVLLIFMTIGMLIILAMSNSDSSFTESYSQQSISTLGLFEFTISNLFLAAFIPLAMLSTWIIHRIRPGFVTSVLGRFRWKWFGWCLLIIVPIWAANFGFKLIANYFLGYENYSVAIENPQLVAIFFLLVFLTIPFQATGEEYLLRGWMLQNIGAFIKDKYIAVVVAGLSSALIFSALHLNFSLYAIIFYFNFSIVAIVMTIKTGGLEAAAGLHIVHNIYVFHLMILVQNNVDRSIYSDIGAVLVNLATDTLFFIFVTAAIIFLAKYKKIEEEYVPDETEVELYNRNQEDFLQRVYFDQYQQYLRQLEYYNNYQSYYQNYYANYYRNY